MVPAIDESRNMKAIQRRLHKLPHAVRTPLEKLMGTHDPHAISDPKRIAAFDANPDNTYLVSFPRTGSHWLRMLCELYFERPSLVRAFYYPEKNDYLMLHTHDMDLDVSRTHVIYLYREPVATIYSQLNYHQESIEDRERIRHWADLYGRHLDKWLHQERFTTHKTIMTYTGMKSDLAQEFAKVTTHFGVGLDADRLAEIAERVSKDEVKKKTQHDPQVVQLKSGYADLREQFRAEQGDFVWEVLLDGRAHLQQDFA